MRHWLVGCHRLGQRYVPIFGRISSLWVKTTIPIIKQSPKIWLSQTSRQPHLFILLESFPNFHSRRDNSILSLRQRPKNLCLGLVLHHFSVGQKGSTCPGNLTNGYQKGGGSSLAKGCSNSFKVWTTLSGYYIPSQLMEHIFPGIMHVNFQGCTLSKLTSLMIYRQCTFMSCIAIVLKCSMVSEHNLDKQMNNVQNPGWLVDIGKLYYPIIWELW